MNLDEIKFEGRWRTRVEVLERLLRFPEWRGSEVRRVRYGPEHADSIEVLHPNGTARAVFHGFDDPAAALEVIAQRRQSGKRPRKSGSA